jgi:hypothetical protein
MVVSWLNNGVSGLVNRWNGLALPSSTIDRDGTAFVPIPNWYEFVWAYYQSAVYALDSPAWGTVRSRSGLPRTIRSVLPLVRPVVDWWPGHSYPSVRTDSGETDRVPYRPDTPDEIVVAGRQAFAWGNWQNRILTYVFHCALFGETFVEIQVNHAAGKVYPRLLHPKYVTHLELNDRDDVVAYTIEIPQRVEGVSYLWGKAVTKETITTLKDGQPYSYDGQPAEQPNPWGFAPAVWSVFRDVGLQHGASAVDGLIPAIDSLNASQSSILDYIQRFIDQMYMIASEHPDQLRAVLDDMASGGPTSDLEDPIAIRQSFNILPAPLGSTAFPLVQNLGLGEAVEHINRSMKAFERNVPELILSERLQDMTQVTAPGAVPLVQDVQHKLDEVTGNLDADVVKLIQMCCSIMGELVNTGTFGLRSLLTDQQKKFLPFTLQSYVRGELDFSLTPRDLLPKSRIELATEAAAIEALATPTGLAMAGLDAGQIWGVNPDGTAKKAPGMDKGGTAGIIAEKEANRTSAAGAFGDLFAAGQVA